MSGQKTNKTSWYPDSYWGEDTREQWGLLFTVYTLNTFCHSHPHSLLSFIPPALNLFSASFPPVLMCVCMCLCVRLCVSY